jgi:hypothetical protein
MVLSLALFFSFYCYSDPAHSQDIQTTPNLVQPQGWQGCLDQHPGWIWGGTVGGPCPVQRAGDGAILFSYGQSTLSQTFAVNQALSGTGIQIRGYEYSWTIKNDNAGDNQSQPYDPLNINVSLYDFTNTQVLETRNYKYSRRINDWTTFTGTEEYRNRYSLATVGNLTLSITSQDVGYWAGYYGPEINHVNLRLRYSVDVCATSPLSSPECPGYAEAYLQQQCSANPLFNSSCPGYAEAYFQLQCSSNPLYNPACPGYQIAYFTQQCSANSLWNPECPGYSVAYQEKLQNNACRANPQNSPVCAGYTAVTAETVTAPVAATTVVDPVASLTEVPLVADPVVNQTLNHNNTSSIARETTASTPVSLGTGLSIPGLSVQPSTRSTTARQRALANARAANASAQGQVSDSQTQQQEAALAAMANLPGFDAYQNAVIPDAQFYQSREIYRGVTIQDNTRAQRALNQRSDRLHQEMINEQYTR